MNWMLLIEFLRRLEKEITIFESGVGIQEGDFECYYEWGMLFFRLHGHTVKFKVDPPQDKKDLYTKLTNLHDLRVQQQVEHDLLLPEMERWLMVIASTL
jgi:hypothetical protein